MNRPASITAPIDAETLALVEQLAEAQGRSVEAYVAEAVQRVAESDADLQSFLRVGIDAADRGELIPHEQVMAELDARMEKHRARCQR